MQGFAEVVQKVIELSTVSKVHWINLREEPLVIVAVLPILSNN
jgi:hypothetical protein